MNESDEERRDFCEGDGANLYSKIQVVKREKSYGWYDNCHMKFRGDLSPYAVYGTHWMKSSSLFAM